MRDGNTSAADGPVESADGSSDGVAIELGDPASIHVILGSSRVRVVLSGEIDADLVADLQEATDDAESSGLPVEIDAHHVTFMDSSGVAFLARLASRSPHRVRVLRAPPTVRFLLEVTRIGEMLDIVDEDPGFELAADQADGRTDGNGSRQPAHSPTDSRPRSGGPGPAA